MVSQLWSGNQYETLAFSFCVSDLRNLAKEHLVIAYN